MSPDVLTVGSTMRIPLLFKGEYLQWSERFMNYLEEKTDGESMINSIKNGDQPLPTITQVSIVGTTSSEQPPLKEKSMCNKTAKDLWDSLERHMLGSEYGEQDRKATVLYEYETFKATEGELLLDTYIRYLQVINDLKKCGYSKNNCELNFKFLNNLQPEWKYVQKKKKVIVSSESKGSDDELKKITALLAKAFNRKKFYSKPTNNNLRTSSAISSANKKQEYVKYDDKKEEKKVVEKKRDVSKVKCYNCKKERHFAKDCKKAKVKDYGYYKTKMLLAKKDKDKQVLFAEDHAWMESSSDSDQEINANMVFMPQMEKVLSDSKASSSYLMIRLLSEKISENLIESQIDHNESDVTHNDSKDVAKLINQMIKEFDKKIVKYQKRLEKANQQCNDFENQNKDLKDKYDVLKNQATIFEEKSNELNEQIKVLIETNADLLAQTNILQDQLKVKHVVIDNHVEYEVVCLLAKEKEKLKIIESLKSKGFEKSEKEISESENQSEKDCQMVENVCDDLENLNVIAPRMFKLSASQSVLPISVTKTSCASNSVESKLKKRHTLSSVRRPKPSDVMWKKNGSSNTVKVDLSSVNHSNLNKNVERYSRKNLMVCNNSDTHSAFDYNNVRNALCNTRMNASVDMNDLFVFDDVSIRKSQVSKIIFWKKPSASLNVPSRSKSLKSLLRIAHKWLPKMNPLAKPIVQIYLWIIDSGCSKYMMGNRSLLTNFMEKFLETVRFENNDFAVIAGYGDVVIGSLTIKRVYYVKGLGEVLHEVSKSFQGESSLSSLNDDVQQSPEEVILPQTNTQSILNDMIPNVNDASSSHNVFNDLLEDAYFDTSTVFHDTSNVHEFYPLHKIIGDPKSSEVYVAQPSGFVSKQYPDHVYAIDKALYGLKQAPRAWYDILSKLLINSGFQKGSIDTTLFIKRKGEHIMLIQIYVNDIIFGSTNLKYCTKFSKLMEKRFEMSMMGEMEFFLGLQVNQFSNGIFINQSKYILYILKRFRMENYDTVPTPMVEQVKPKLDLVGKPVDHIVYRSMIGSLMYLTSSRPDIMFATCMCARYQANPNDHHVSAVKRIFRYLKGTINLGLWYPKDHGFDLTAYSDADHAGCHLDRKSTSGNVQFLGDNLVCWSSKKQNCVSISTAESEYVAISGCCAHVLWMRTQLTDYGFFYDKVPIYYDSMSAIAISCNLLHVKNVSRYMLRGSVFTMIENSQRSKFSSSYDVSEDDEKQKRDL
nr:uncharacterized mitochondrial protein AtMg00810-like [Tanacetum cinerariifolium]